MFYVYDFKFSGEYRVRLVFYGSRQSETTYKETYAPTVRAESVRLFHIYCVTEGLHIGQYDVPQAFLKADIDHDMLTSNRLLVKGQQNQRATRPKIKEEK